MNPRLHPWTKAEDELLLAKGPSFASKALGRGYPACTVRLQRLRGSRRYVRKQPENAGDLTSFLYGETERRTETLAEGVASGEIKAPELRDPGPGQFPEGAGNTIQWIPPSGGGDPNIVPGAPAAEILDALNKAEPYTFAQDRAEHAAARGERLYRDLQKKYAEALKALAVVDRLVESAKDMAPQSYQALPSAIPPTVRHADGSPQSAVLHLSDPHVGLVVSPKQTLNFGGYNFQIFLARLGHLEDSMRSIVTHHTTTPIEELVIAWGGDIVNGSLEHAAEAGQESTVFAQVYGAAHAFAQFLRNIAPLFPNVRNFCVAGNHGRWSNQKKMPTQNRYSNLDSFVYALTAALTRDLPNVVWTIDEQPVADFMVQGYRFLSMHGDVWKGGDKALGLPAHAIGRQLATSASLYAKSGLVPPAYILSGHLHRQFEIPTASGAVLINGGWPGIDTYSLAAAFTPVDPSQRFFFVHPRYKITAAYSLWLAHAEGPDNRYVIPEGISIE